MSEQETSGDMNKALFINLVMMLSSSAMQQLGKLVNPGTHKTEMNLEAAQVTIDLLGMLRDKTRGNLDSDEERMINDLLASLQMNYVETVRSAPAQAGKGAPTAESPKPSAESPSGGSEPEPTEKKDPKYHKTYGS